MHCYDRNVNSFNPAYHIFWHQISTHLQKTVQVNIIYQVSKMLKLTDLNGNLTIWRKNGCNTIFLSRENPLAFIFLLRKLSEYPAVLLEYSHNYQ